MEKEIQALEARFLEIEAIFEAGDDDHQLIFDLEEKIQYVFHEIDPEYEDAEAEKLEKLNKRVKEFKLENNFFNAEAELDRMFPDRHDADFDQDEMSGESFFKD